MINYIIKKSENVKYKQKLIFLVLRFLDFLSGKDHVTECERDVHEDEFAFSYEESSDSDIEEDFPTSETPSPNLSSSHHSTSSSPGSTHTPLARRRCL